MDFTTIVKYYLLPILGGGVLVLIWWLFGKRLGSAWASFASPFRRRQKAISNKDIASPDLQQRIDEVKEKLDNTIGELKRKAEQPEDTVEARIYDIEKRMIYNDHIGRKVLNEIKAEHRTLGRKWLKDGRWVYAFTKVKDGVYHPIFPPETIDFPPSELHNALSQDEVAIIYDVSEPKPLLQKLLPVLIFAGCAIFAMFMISHGK